MNHTDTVPGEWVEESTPTHGSYQNTVVDKTWHKKQLRQQARSSLYRIFFTLALLLIVYTDLRFQTISSQFVRSNFLIYQSELVLMLFLFANLGKNLYDYMRPLMTATVDLNPEQRRLLAVKDTDVGFRTSPPRSLISDQVVSSPLFSPSTSAHSSYSPSLGSPNTSRQTSPVHHSFFTDSRLSPRHQSFFTESQYSRGSSHGMLMGNTSLSSDPNMSGYLSNQSLYQSLDSSGLRARYTSTSPIKTSSGTSTDRITDFLSLSTYMKEQDEREYKSCLGSSPDMSMLGNSSFWNYGAPLDPSIMLRKYQYQLSSRSPQSSTVKNNENDQSASYRSDEVWHKLGVTEDQLFVWIERLRKWLCQSIVARLSKEVEDINASLRRIGCEDTQIGDVGVSTLKQLALTKGSHVPSLNATVPLLDLSSNQEYLVKRIKDLGKDGCMSEFAWNRGGDYGKPWGEHLPTDSAVVMHLFCTYLDSRLPPQPKFPDGKTFTNQYFLKTPDKPNLTKKDNFFIYQLSVNPPHYQVIIEDDVWNLSKGRNNMFQAILLFLYHVRLKEQGMLGRVNLGMSGINIMWLFN